MILSRFIRSALALGLLAAAAAPGSAFARETSTPATPDEVESLKRQIQELQAAQAALQKELQEIKKQLPSGRPSPPGPIAEVQFETVLLKSDPVKGEPSARVVMIEYSDFECPFCAQFARAIAPQIDRDYVITGKIQYVFRDLPLLMHPRAQAAAEAAGCARLQGKFWPMYEQLFSNPRRLEASNLTAYAEVAGVDLPKFQQCLAEHQPSDAIEKDKADAARIAITGTPSFAIGILQPDGSTIKISKIVRGAFPFEIYRKAIEDVLATVR
jgi:protein-disulfide isomerase